jgi:hypothetical protein
MVFVGCEWLRWRFPVELRVRHADDDHHRHGHCERDDLLHQNVFMYSTSAALSASDSAIPYRCPPLPFPGSDVSNLENV